MTTKLKLNDWCFCEFELSQISEMKDETITSVSNGSTQLSSGSGLNERCFPLEMSVKRKSDAVQYWMDQLHKVKHINLNYPDLHRELVRRWVELCSTSNDDEIKSLYDSLAEFCRGVIYCQSTDVKYKVGGIFVYRQ